MQKRPGSDADRPADAGFETWLANLEELGEERGYFEPVGDAHSAILTDEGATLLVTFERAADIRTGNADDMPLGWHLTRDNGWSNLCLLAHRDTWFRDKAFFGYLDRVIDDGFFEDFDRVIFYGAGMCGYAAAAFSVVAPGAIVLAIQPQATLDPEVTEWDRRFPEMRRTSFTDRYGSAPDMIEAAEQAFVVYDPLNSIDAMHASLFERPNVTRLRCHRMGDRIDAALIGMKALPALIDAAGSGDLDAGHFYRTIRARRRYAPYLRRLLDMFEANRQPKRVRMLCNSVTARLKAPRYAHALARAERQLAAQSPAPETAEISL